MANVLKLLRNNALFATRQAAIEYTQRMAQTLGDGELWTASYGTGNNNDVKSIIALKRTGGTTIFDLESIQENSFKYKVNALSAAEIETLQDENVAEAYRLVSYQGEETQQTVYTPAGSVIKIYKDSSLKEVYLGASSDTVNATTGVVTKNTVADPQSMNFVHQLADGTYSMTKIDVSKFLTQSEFGDGLQVSNAGVVSVKPDSTSEKLRIADDVYYTQSECDTANSQLTGYIPAQSTLTEEQATAVNNALELTGDDAYETGDTLSTEDANDYNATLDGAISVNDVKTSGETDAVTIGPDGIKIDGIQDAIDYSLADLQSALNDKADVSDLEDYLQTITAGNGISVGQAGNNTQTVSVNLDSVQTDNALSVSSDGLYFSKTIDCGTY